MSTRTAELHITQTSETCIRYELRAGEGTSVRCIWSNRVAPSEAGHAGARTRMAAWALAHGVEVVEAQPAPAQAIIQGRYGRH